MDCPHCRSEMRAVTQDSVAADVCDACGGIWLDREELLRVMPRLPTAEAPDDGLFGDPELSSTRACPRCDGAPPLYEVGLGEVADLQLDTCRSCKALFVALEEAEAVGRFLKWQADEPEGLEPLTSVRLLQLIHALAESYGPGGDDRPSWNDVT
jgi:Zn-finger nucleic acid-binding protein